MPDRREAPYSAARLTTRHPHLASPSEEEEVLRRHAVRFLHWEYPEVFNRRLADFFGL